MKKRVAELQKCCDDQDVPIKILVAKHSKTHLLGSFMLNVLWYVEIIQFKIYV